MRRLLLALSAIVIALVIFAPTSYAYDGEQEDVDDAIDLLQDIANRELNEGANDDDDLEDDDEIDERDHCICEEPNCDDPDCIDARELEEIREVGGPVKKFWRRRRYRFRRRGRLIRRIRFRFRRTIGKK